MPRDHVSLPRNACPCDDAYGPLWMCTECLSAFLWCDCVCVGGWWVRWQLPDEKAGKKKPGPTSAGPAVEEEVLIGPKAGLVGAGYADACKATDGAGWDENGYRLVSVGLDSDHTVAVWHSRDGNWADAKLAGYAPSSKEKVRSSGGSHHGARPAPLLTRPHPSPVTLPPSTHIGPAWHQHVHTHWHFHMHTHVYTPRPPSVFSVLPMKQANNTCPANKCWDNLL